MIFIIYPVTPCFPILSYFVSRKFYESVLLYSLILLSFLRIETFMPHFPLSTTRNYMLKSSGLQRYMRILLSFLYQIHTNPRRGAAGARRAHIYKSIGTRRSLDRNQLSRLILLLFFFFFSPSSSIFVPLCVRQCHSPLNLDKGFLSNDKSHPFFYYSFYYSLKLSSHSDHLQDMRMKLFLYRTFTDIPLTST